MAYLSDEFMTEGYLESLEQITGLEASEILGRLMLLWHTSQKRKMQTGSAANLTAWSRVKKKGAHWITALLEVGLLKQIEEDEYEIVGNAKRFAYIEARSEHGKKAAEGRWAPLRLIKKADAPSMLRAMPEQSTCYTTTTTTTTTPKERIRGSSDPLPLLHPSEPKKYTNADMVLANEWLAFATGVSKTIRPNMDAWANEVRKMREIDNVPMDEIRNILEFVKTSEFWRANAASLQHLRSRSKNGLMKYENILNAMKKIVPENQSLYDSIDLPEVRYE